jgi:hypothetical protein
LAKQVVALGRDGEASEESEPEEPAAVHGEFSRSEALTPSPDTLSRRKTPRFARRRPGPEGLLQAGLLWSQRPGGGGGRPQLVVL